MREQIYRWRGEDLTVAELREFLDEMPYTSETTSVRVTLTEKPPTRIEHAVTEIVLEVVI